MIKVKDLLLIIVNILNKNDNKEYQIVDTSSTIMIVSKEGILHTFNDIHMSDLISIIDSESIIMELIDKYPFLEFMVSLLPVIFRNTDTAKEEDIALITKMVLRRKEIDSSFDDDKHIRM